MIVFKPKDVYVTDPYDSLQISDDPVRYVPVCYEVWQVDDILITYHKIYSDDMSTLGPVAKKQVKSLIKDIKSGYFYADSQSNPDSDTHVLPKLSSKRKIIWSKSYSTSDRVTYAIYPPEEYTDQDGNTKISVRVDILSCKEHKLSKEKRYTEGEGQ